MPAEFKRLQLGDIDAWVLPFGKRRLMARRIDFDNDDDAFRLIDAAFANGKGIAHMLGGLVPSVYPYPAETEAALAIVFEDNGAKRALVVCGRGHAKSSIAKALSTMMEYTVAGPALSRIILHDEAVRDMPHYIHHAFVKKRSKKGSSFAMFPEQLQALTEGARRIVSFLDNPDKYFQFAAVEAISLV